MADMDNLITDIKVSLARIEEKQASTSKELTSLKESMNAQFNGFKNEYDHKLSNLKQSQDNFMPKREIDAKIDSVKAHCDTNRAVLVERVSKIEERLTYYGRWALGLCASSFLMFVANLLLKFLLK